MFTVTHLNIFTCRISVLFDSLAATCIWYLTQVVWCSKNPYIVVQKLPTKNFTQIESIYPTTVWHHHINIVSWVLGELIKTRVHRLWEIITSYGFRHAQATTKNQFAFLYLKCQSKLAVKIVVVHYFIRFLPCIQTVISSLYEWRQICSQQFNLIIETWVGWSEYGVFCAIWIQLYAHFMI